MLDGAPHDCPLEPLHPLPRLTAGLAGCGGQLRVLPEDFEVEEIPLYEPSGVGDHLYLWIEKIDVAGETLRRHIARALDISGMDIGMAGLKDRRAVTRQWISVPKSAESKVSRIEDGRIRVLDARPHRNKLRTGHLTGNRFRLRVRGVGADAETLVAAKLQRLAALGMPNFYGAQRMGHGGSTLAAGWALLRGYSRLVRVRMPDETVHSLNLSDRPLRRLAASAVQSEVFNRTVARRMELGLLETVIEGDLCQKTDTGGMFVTDDLLREQRRLETAAIDVTAPMWGPKMMRPDGQASRIELEVLAAFGLTEADFAAIGNLAPGTRRAMLCRLGDPQVGRDDAGLTVAFSLPAGSFATVLLHELMGPVAGEDLVEADEDVGQEGGEAVEPCA